MAKLTDEQKAFIVMSFARYATREEIRKVLRETWNINDMTGSHLDAYDPNSARIRLHPTRYGKWRKLYDDTRAAMLSDLSEIKISNPAYRLHVLDKLVDRAVDKGNATLAASLLEQAAKEVGGLYTNTREVKAKVDHTHRADETTEEERKAILADKIREALNTTALPSAS